MAIYEQQGVHFEYPENWKLDDDPSDQSQTTITVFSPGGAFWTLSVLPRDIDLPLMLKTLLDALADEYQDIDSGAVSDQVESQAMVGYDVNFYCLDLTTSALIRGFQTLRASYVLLCQAEDREFTRVKPVFDAMTTSLVRAQLAGREA